MRASGEGIFFLGIFFDATDVVLVASASAAAVAAGASDAFLAEAALATNKFACSRLSSLGLLIDVVAAALPLLLLLLPIAVAIAAASSSTTSAFLS